MKVFLIAPRNERGCATAFPLGIAYISAALKNAGHEVLSLNLALCDEDLLQVEAQIRDFGPAMVGIGGLTPSFAQIRRVHQAIRKAFPGLITVLGGGVLTSAVEVVFRGIEPDFGVVGEGDITIVELAAALESGADAKAVQGLVYRGEDKALVRTPPRPPIPDLDALPLPDYEGLGFESYHKMGVVPEILGSRGCPYSCTFCYSPLGRRYRQRSLDHLFKEIEYMVQTFGVRYMGISDELFAAAPARVKEFCGRIGPMRLVWLTQLRVDSVDEPTLRLMRDNGCRLISYGLESMHPGVLSSMNKKVTPAKIEKTLEMTYDLGINVFGNFIFGDPAETRDTADATLEWWFANRKHLINLGCIQSWPGSKIYKDAVTKGLIADELDFIASGCPEINLTSMSDEQYLKMIRRNDLYHHSLLFPAKLREARQEDNGAWSLVALCPHCGALSSHAGVNEASIPFNRSTVRLDCGCGRQFDLPVLVPRPRFPAGVEEEAARIGELALQGDAAALALLEDICARHVKLAAARFLAARTHRKAGNLEKAYLYTAKTLRADPTIPEAHDLMSRILEEMGEDLPSRVYAEQAALIRNCQPPGWINPALVHP